MACKFGLPIDKAFISTCDVPQTRWALFTGGYLSLRPPVPEEANHEFLKWIAWRPWTHFCYLARNHHRVIGFALCCSSAFSSRGVVGFKKVPAVETALLVLHRACRSLMRDLRYKILIKAFNF
jgi:hypothetical protein